MLNPKVKVAARIGAVWLGVALFFSFVSGMAVSVISGGGSGGMLQRICFAPVAPGFWAGGAIARPGFDDAPGLLAALTLGIIFDFFLYAAAVYGVVSVRARWRSRGVTRLGL